ncbi:MAG: hypothetical protein ACXWLM_02145 [Myxococcales bacterium]
MAARRAIGVLGAFAIALQALGALPMPAASCCCATKMAKCHCPACAHAREIESGCRYLQGCAPSAQRALAAASLPALPPSDALPPQRVARGMPDLPLPAFAPNPPLEVPTPPPLRA